MTYDPDLYGPPEYDPLDPDDAAAAEALAELYVQLDADLDEQEADDE
jgi:hypothetical protein